MKTLQAIIEKAFDQRTELNAENTPIEIHQAIYETINLLDIGKCRVAEKINHEWVVHEWLKKAVLLFFKTQSNHVMNTGAMQFFDKVPMKFHDLTEAQFQENNIRVVPSAIAR